jgi:hypothetical protein
MPLLVFFAFCGLTTFKHALSALGCVNVAETKVECLKLRHALQAICNDRRPCGTKAGIAQVECLEMPQTI